MSVLRQSPHWAAVACAAAVIASSHPATAQERYALAMFHFNVQYVAGGMVGYWAVPHPEIDLDNDEIEDRIITESFAPIVDLFDRHPGWGVDLEMQGYMLDIIAERHPSLLEKLRGLAKAGNVNVLSFHYSDQLFIGYPQEDWIRSRALAEETFDKHDIPLSRSVFCQEGQASMGMASRMSENGYRTMIWPKNLWRYQHGDFDAQPLYRFGDIFMVAGAQDVTYDDGTTAIDVRWTFFDDGELLATGDVAPYMPDIFLHNPEAVAEWEQQLVDLESQGYAIVSVDQYVEAVKDRVPLADPPPLLDGTWQPDSTDGVFRWMGNGGLWTDQERDNTVRTLGAVAHREMVAAEAMVAKAGIDRSEALASAWRLLFLGQVTDATGINPFRGEIQYGIGHFTEVLRIARDLIGEAKDAMASGSVVIDPASGAVEAGTERLYRGDAVDAPIALRIDGGTRVVEQRWERVADGHDRVSVTFGPGDGLDVRVTFPAPLRDEMVVTLALQDDTPVTFRRSDFVFEHFHFALPTGLIGLDESRFVIKDQAHVHVAAEVQRESGDITFVDETLGSDETAEWVFHLYTGTAQDAVALADRINAHRRLSR